MLSAILIPSESAPTIIDFLENSKVVFNKSDTRKDSCRVYHLKGIGKYQEIIINAENCSKVVSAELIKS